MLRASICFQDILPSSSFLCVLSTAASSVEGELEIFQVDFQATHSSVEKHIWTIKLAQMTKTVIRNNRPGLRLIWRVSGFGNCLPSAVLNCCLDGAREGPQERERRIKSGFWGLIRKKLAKTDWIGSGIFRGPCILSRTLKNGNPGTAEPKHGLELFPLLFYLLDSMR